jgi:DNA-binding NarL/FixJ family response regulator
MAMNRSLMALGTGHLMLGHVEQGMDHLRRQHEFAHQVGKPRFIGVGFMNWSESLIWADRQEEALALARTGIERSSAYGFDIYLLPIVGNAVRALAELHRWDEALDSTQDPDDPAADPFNWVFVDLPRADILVKRGDLVAAAELLKRTGAVLDGQDDVQYGTELATIRARLAGRERRWDDARTALREGLRVALPAEDMWLTTRLVATGVQIEADAVDDARASGAPVDIGAARAAADAVLADGRCYQADLEAGGAVPLPRTRRARGLAAAERTRLDPSPDPAAWAEVVRVAGVDRHLAGYAGYREAEALLLARGSRSRATEALAQAGFIAADLGATPLATMVRALADRARLVLPTAAPPAAATIDSLGLTAREAEILALVGRGLTNAEIAGELFISTKTASVHVSNILRKLGLKSRIQAAALAQRRNSGVERP